MEPNGHIAVNHPEEVDWYYLDDGVQVGPLSERSLIGAARQNRIGPATLIWQRGFTHWKQAATIPMVAVNLGAGACAEEEVLGLGDSTDSASPMPATLGDAVNDDEAAEPPVDLQQVRAILQRASRPPPERASSTRTSRPPQERTIPPASVSTNPPGPMRTLQPRRLGQWIPLAAIPLAIGVVGVVLITRATRRSSAPSVAVEARAEASNPSASGSGAPGPRALDGDASSQSAADHATPNTNATPESAALASDLASVISGSLDVQILNAKLQRALPMFDQQCWDRLRVHVPRADSNPAIRVEMSIDRNGNVYAIEASKSPRGYWGAGPCIIGRMRGWKFPRAESGSRATVTVSRIHD